ncbi:MAG: hypothetical protein ACPG9T_15460, partial [Pseudomonadales bacterium]
IPFYRRRFTPTAVPQNKLQLFWEGYRINQELARSPALVPHPCHQVQSTENKSKSRAVHNA